MKALLLLLLFLSAAVAADQPPRFSQSGLSGWTAESIVGRKPSLYTAAEDGGVTVMAARCEDSASYLGWAAPVDLEQTPMLNWRWKVAQIYPGLDETVKSGSDFPARVYVIAGKRWMPWTLHTIEYAWSNGRGQAASWPSPYAGSMGQAVIVPVRAGADGVGQWQQETRDVQADFRRFFGMDLDKIGGVALMSDCDDSHGQGQAWFGDLWFTPRPALDPTKP